MSDRRLRQGHHEARNLWQYHRDEAPASKSGECVGRVDSADLAAEICEAVNARRAAVQRDLADQVRRACDADWLTEEQTAAVMQVVAPHLADTAELDRLRELETTLSGAVWVHPGIQGGTPCVGGTRVPAADVAGLIADDVPPEDIARYYPGVDAEGARAAAAFADRFVDRRARDRTDTDPRTEVEAHWGGDPERIVSAWEHDRAETEAEVERLATELAEERTAHQAAIHALEQARADLDHATHFQVGAYRVGRTSRGVWQVWGDPALGGYRRLPHAEEHADRDAALGRARQIAGEVTMAPSYRPEEIRSGAGTPDPR